MYIGGHNEASLERTAKYGRGWLPGWRPFTEIAKRIAIIKRRAEELGRDRTAVFAPAKALRSSNAACHASFFGVG
jgi:alkanesulfonate monooxygenase SsuD/methylene tetrahydromethanopterin reductase-like flavin-dependent oxidoreductase (luciferase family)